MIKFDLGTSGQQLTFSDAVLLHLKNRRQLKFWQAEAGGLLFARLSAEDVSSRSRPDRAGPTGEDAGPTIQIEMQSSAR
jgi:hypothetical protein